MGLYKFEDVYDCFAFGILFHWIYWLAWHNFIVVIVEVKLSPELFLPSCLFLSERRLHFVFVDLDDTHGQGNDSIIISMIRKLFIKFCHKAAIEISLSLTFFLLLLFLRI